jgi:hypothetical protein
MAIDAYSLCPGGTGKKIKFCCNDFLPELQKIDRMVEGEQYLACLKHIDQLLDQEPGRNRACLLATKCALLRAAGQDDAAQATATLFAEKHPDNQVALAELAILAARTDARKALELVGRALRAAKGNLGSRTYQAMGITAGALLHAGLPLPARALLQVQFDVMEDDDRPAELLSALSQATDVPLLLRDDLPIMPCPADAPWKGRFDEALQSLASADWQSGVERLAALTAEVPNEPAIWRNLATFRGWLADTPACSEALRKYASLRVREADGLEDAVEAEAEALFLASDPLGDGIDVVNLTWTIKDVEAAHEALLSAPRFQTVPCDPAQFSDGQTPPPKAAFMLFDRPMPASAEGLSLDAMPRLLGQALLFGRQTDREAQLDVMGIASDELSDVIGIVNETAGASLEPQSKQVVVGHWSASQKLLRSGWQPPRDITPDQLRTLLDQHRNEAVLDRWPELKLGVLDGRTPREAAGDEAYRTRVLAAILVLEYYASRAPGQFNFNQLRSRLGLPELGPIDPQQQHVAHLPINRLARLMVEKLSDQDLTLAFYRAGAFALMAAQRKFAEAIVTRPSLAEADDALQAYATLARTEEKFDKALEYIEKGRQLMGAKKGSNASWDLMELSLSFTARDPQRAMRLVQHLQERHGEEPGVAEALTRMLIDVGLLRPDGTPAYMPGGPEGPMAGPEAPAAEPGGLWTPDSAQPSSGGGKLWTPD